MNDKRFYWIKLKTDFFNREDIDFLLSQENGCQYVVLYQMLCLNTANNNGFLENKINEVIIPYDIKKIVRDTKYFDYDTVAVALELFKKLGLIYKQEDKILKISNFEDMVGSETKYAQIKRKQRSKNLVPLVNCKRLNDNMLRLPNGNTTYVDEKRYGGNGMLAYDLANGKCEICGSEENLCIHHNNGYSNDINDLYILCRNCHSKVENKGVDIVHNRVYQEIRDKSIEYRDIDNKSIDIKKENIKRKKFVKPTIEEIQSYCLERNNGINAEAFYDFYESKDWFVGKNKMKDWKACVRTWEKRETKNNEEYKSKIDIQRERQQKIMEDFVKGV